MKFGRGRPPKKSDIGGRKGKRVHCVKGGVGAGFIMGSKIDILACNCYFPS